MIKFLLISCFTFIILTNCADTKEVKQNGIIENITIDSLVIKVKKPTILNDKGQKPSRGLKEIPDSVNPYVLKKFWNKSRIQTFYKLDEQHNFTDNSEEETKWVSTLIEQIVQFGYVMDSQRTRPSNGLNWNPTNDLYYFVTVPNDANEVNIDFYDHIEITVNGIPIPEELIRYEESEYGQLVYYKLPVWFWQMDIVSQKVTSQDLQIVFGKDYRTSGPMQLSEPSGIEKLKTEVFRVYLKDDANYEDEVIEVKRISLKKDYFLYSLASC